MAIGTPTLCAATFTSGGGSPYNVTTTATVPSGALIIMLGSWGRSVTITATASGGGLTWSTDQSFTFNGGYFYGFGVFSAQAPSGLASGTTLTLTTSTACDGSNITICYCTGLATSSAKDVSAGQGASTKNWDSGAATSLNANDLIIGGSFYDGSTTSTAGAGLTELTDFVNASNAWTQTTVYQIASATGSYKANGTWTGGATNCVSGFVAYKDDGGGGGGSPTVMKLPALGVG